MEADGAWKPYDALEELAAGGLRRPDSRSRALLTCAWPILQRRVRRVCWSVGIRDAGQRHEVEQRVGLELWGCRMNYRGSTTREFNGFFFQIARRIASRVRKEPDPVGSPEGSWEPGSRSDEPALPPEEKQGVRECLQRLCREDSKAYDAVFLVYLLGMTHEEAGRLLKRRKSTVGERVQRGLRRLKRCLEGRLRNRAS